MPLFSVENHHDESCGQPPVFEPGKRDPKVYRSYFEGVYGEQWIFEGNTETGQITVYGGDYDWDKKLTVKRVSLSSILAVAKTYKSEQIYNLSMFILLFVGTQAAKPIRMQRVLLQLEYDKVRNRMTSLTSELDSCYLLVCNGSVVCLEFGESIWLNACMETSGIDPQDMTAAELKELLNKREDAVADDTNEDHSS